ncbi:nucleotide disphospho-sugar-binding domain-containing protein [Agreia pratensis]|uniref:Glycosyltransferase, MGT family n=1 Tax=Agreia pratensis TaxID=150121 RepID=A0A1X7JDD8_9MICO|nr:nucleotide disphospho-sugar-binding domain-containing protein [Agreia pratensis]SMG25985.1 glycosyltransferase, MGT family [Agreia pratensis]
MANYLICSTPVHHHVSPMIAVGAYLVSRGHRVIMITGTRFAEQIKRAGMEFVAFEGRADFDDRDVPSYLPFRERYRGIARLQYDVQNIFIKTIPAQFRTARNVLQRERIDAVLVDGAFGGMSPVLSSSAPRPPVLAVGVISLVQFSCDTAPAGLAMAPSSSGLGRARNRILNALARHVFFRDTQRAAQQAMAEIGAVRLPHFAMDISSAFDRFLQLGPATLEYPRSDLSPNVRFIGALPTEDAAALPEWWNELDGSRAVVYVSQGVIDNQNFDRLIRPTIAALAKDDVLVVVSTGGRAAERLGAVASNVRVAETLPYDRLLNLVDVVVTNGEYGEVQAVLAAGVPLVVAGGTEDKPESAARVSWSGAGIDLRTGTPTAAAVGSAVRAVLADERYRARARRFAAELAELDTLRIIEEELAQAVAARSSR